ncbi:hypothetical protein GCM10020331_020600 [Ectobacillus funiculus]
MGEGGNIVKGIDTGVDIITKDNAKERLNFLKRCTGIKKRTEHRDTPRTQFFYTIRYKTPYAGLIQYSRAFLRIKYKFLAGCQFDVARNFKNKV